MKPRRMSEAALMSPNTDILTTPKPETGGLKTPKFREFSEALSALRSPRDIAEASLNTPLALTTPLPIIAQAQDLSTPTLTTPRTADWGLFSPIALGSNCSSPRESLSSRDNRPADLPLDSSIGLSSPHDGILAKRRKLKNLSSSHSRSVESDSNSCDTPTQEAGPPQTSLDAPRDLTKKSCDRDLRGCQSPSSTTDTVDTVRDRVGDVRISSPKWFKHPKHLDRLNLSSKELLSDIPSSYHPSPLAVPSPNWTAIKELLCSNTQTPKVLDNFVFDVLPPNTPLTPTAKTALASCRERSPEPLNYEAKHKPSGEPEQPQPRPHKLNGGQRVTFADCPPRPGSLTPPPPCPQDLSMRKESTDHAPGHPMVMPKTEYDPGPPVTSVYSRGHSPPPYPVKEEPREAPPGLPPGFPPYYLPDLAPHHLYRQSGDHQRLAPTSPPASPPRSHPTPPASNHYGGGGQPRPQFYGGLSLSSLYEGHGGHGASAATHAQYNMWNGGSHHGGHDMGHVTMPTPWGRVTSEGHNSHVTGANNGLTNIQNHFNNLKPCLDLKAHVKSEHRLSTESQDSTKKKARKMKSGEGSEVGGGDHLDSSLDGQPPKKKGKGKSKVNKDPNAPKRVFVCPHCNVGFTFHFSGYTNNFPPPRRDTLSKFAQKYNCKAKIYFQISSNESKYDICI